VLKAMQDPEYCRFLDDAIYQERRRGFPQGIRCVGLLLLQAQLGAYRLFLACQAGCARLLPS